MLNLTFRPKSTPPPPPLPENGENDLIASEVFGPEFNDGDSSTVSNRESIKEEVKTSENRSKPFSSYSK